MKNIVEFLLSKNKPSKVENEFPENWCLAYPVDKVYKEFDDNWHDRMVKDSIGAHMFIMPIEEIEEYRKVSKYPRTYLRIYEIPSKYKTIEELKQAFDDKNQSVCRANLNLLESKQLNEYLLGNNNKKVLTPIDEIKDNLGSHVKDYELVISKMEKWYDDSYEYQFACDLIAKALNAGFIITKYSIKGSMYYTSLDGKDIPITKDTKIMRVLKYGPEGIAIEILNCPKQMDDMIVVQAKIDYFRFNWIEWEDFARDYNTGNVDYDEIDSDDTDKIYEILK